MVGEKKEEDIVGRLEALRKKVPPAPPGGAPPKAPSPAPPAADERRRRLARILGILVIVIVLGSVFYVGYTMFIRPMKTPAPTMAPSGEEQAQEQARLAELAKAKSEKIKAINDAFAGLPQDYTTAKAGLIEKVNSAATKAEVEAVDHVTPATEAWRSYRTDILEEKSTITGKVIAYVGDRLIKGVEEIRRQIDRGTLPELQEMTIKEAYTEYIPIRLPREQITGGFAEVGDMVNIHYRWTEKVNGTDVDRIKYLAKNGRIVAIMRAASTISLSESQSQTELGGGSEGKGNVTSLTLGSGGISISDGPYGASVGYKTLERSTSYTVNLAEVQKAAVANRIPEEELMKDLEKYGVRLTEMERETNIGDLDAEYLMLVEVSEEEASEVVLRLLDKNDKANILVTISKPPSWAS
ncbi:MAG: DUF515 domain-containing protein [Methanobacteriota archaeon]|nr:MAG: DUF515 domain-containing protein [Euryarchaeota archaeon]